MESRGENKNLLGRCFDDLRVNGEYSQTSQLSAHAEFVSESAVKNAQ
jgi:hypothetical protein